MEEEKPRTSRAVPTPSILRFGPYELDLRSTQLRKKDLKIRLQDQPFQILVALLERPGELILREEIRRKLWCDDTVVEFDHGINAAVKRLRDALRDSAEKPRYIETVARRGYRFIAPVEALAPSERAATVVPQSQPVPESSPATVDAAPTPPPSATSPGKKRWMVAAALAGTLIAAGMAVPWLRRSMVNSTSEMTRLTFDSGLTTDPAVSPDGKLLAYASDRHGSGPLHLWVQQFLPDGQAMQLTRGEADDHQPAFSPDGSKLVFRSERDGGGIYVIPAIGGEAILLAKGGRDPRFSPDGRWIAYWAGTMLGAPLFANAGTVYLVPSTGGSPQLLLSDLTQAGVPVWSQDGTRLILYGRKDDLPPNEGGWNWWVVPVQGGSATSTGAFEWLREKGFTTGLD